MSNTFSYQNLTITEGQFLGIEKPSELDKLGRFTLVFAGFINTSEKVYPFSSVADFLGGTVKIKVSPELLTQLQPILKSNKLYRLVIGARPWSINSRHGVSYRLIDIKEISLADSLFMCYVGLLSQVAIDSAPEEVAA